MSILVMPKPGSKRHQGFSLLEILVAFSILAMSITVILNIFSSGVRAAFLAEEYTIAVQLAESLLAETGVVTDLESAGTSSNNADKFQWQVDVSPIDPGIKGYDTLTSDFQMYQVIVRVYWSEGQDTREVVLQTLKLGALAQ